jgi:hypothetical protein
MNEKEWKGVKGVKRSEKEWKGVKRSKMKENEGKYANNKCIMRYILYVFNIRFLDRQASLKVWWTTA